LKNENALLLFFKLTINKSSFLCFGHLEAIQNNLAILNTKNNVAKHIPEIKTIVQIDMDGDSRVIPACMAISESILFKLSEGFPIKTSGKFTTKSLSTKSLICSIFMNGMITESTAVPNK
jgi:hypothetical protein